MDVLLLCAFVGAVGLAVGSFLNVVIWRVPRGESVVRPPSACPRCGTAIHPRDNIPVVSWLLLRGRCRSCSEPISARYPLVELLTGAVFVTLTLKIGFDAALPAYLYFGAVGVALAVIDLDVHRLPDALTLPSYPVAAVLLGLAAVSDGPRPLIRAVICASISLAFFFCVWFVYPKGMGFGDVKLSGLLGLYLGWISYGALAAGIFAGYLLGGLVSVGLVIFGGAGRKTQIPFGPFLLIGTLLGILGGDEVVSAYLSATTGV